MKKTCIIFLTLFALLCGLSTVEAKTTDELYTNGITEIKDFRVDAGGGGGGAPSNTTGAKEGEKGSKKCNSLFGDPTVKGTLAFYLQWALEVMKYLGIILCIVLTIVDFFKALIGEEKDAYKPLAKKALQRLIYAVCLFFTPIFVKVLLNLIGVYGTCGIG